MEILLQTTNILLRKMVTLPLALILSSQAFNFGVTANNFICNTDVTIDGS